MNGENEKLTDGGYAVIGFHIDVPTHAGSAVQDGTALAAMGIGVAGLGLRSGSCMANGGKEGEND